MKFGRYLAENATPEWQRAYIDYRALKKQIKRISSRLRDEGDDVDDRSSDDDDHGPSRRAADSEPRTHTDGVTPPGTIGPGASSAASIVPGSAPSRSPGSLARTPSTAKSPPTRSPLKTPGSTLPKLSPNYGAMGRSPALTEGSTGPCAHTQISTSLHGHGAPPHLDLGGPAMESTESHKERWKQSARSRNVNFSPMVQAISDDGSGDADEEDEEDEEDVEEPAPASVSAAPIGPAIPTDTGLLSPDHWRRKKKISAGAPSKLSLIPSRGQASVGVSPAGTADAPSGSRSIRSLRLPSPKLQARNCRTFDELYDTLAPDEQEFFDLLDKQLEKVETFYSARESEATRRYHQLRDQLKELAEHRRIFHEQYPEGVPQWEAKMGRALQIPGYEEFLPKAAQKLHLRNPFTQDGDGSGKTSGNSDPATPPDGNGNGNGNGNGLNGTSKLPKQYDPERYMRYKKDLRNAMLEYYRQLELLKNYRILNLTGFRKALKKFEKATKVQCLELYTEDRIGPCSFARGETIDTLIKQAEELFTEHFEHGDVKRARMKLREGDQPHTHYLTVFRSGTMIGLGLPAMVLAIVKSFEKETRTAIPDWASLLQVYGGFYIPVLFAMLIELNLGAWVEARINYEFVMELNRPTLDFRSYLEIPSFLFMTLSYCFFFTFYRVATHSVAETTWPLAWIVFVCAFFLNPLPLFRRRSRYWLLKVLARVCTPGYSRVEFIVFFMADELNSLVYTIQNFMYIGCAYSKHWPRGQTSHVCHSGSTWPYALLASLPPLSRLIQCVKRYYDSGLYIHLINAGKYCSSILTACLFVYWRSQDKPFEGAPFVVWVIFATVSSFYTTAWDLVVDWSLLRPGCRGLRRDLGYGSTTWYYFAMATNVLIRFIWVWYIPDHAKYTKLRSWAFAMCEMLRRWQWNFFRVETEHLGNADAYRVTREIPLPYRDTKRSDDEDDDLAPAKENKSTPIVAKLRRIRAAVVGTESGGRGLDALNVGARGHAAQREYEARRPGDMMRTSSLQRASTLQRSASRRTATSEDSNV